MNSESFTDQKPRVFTSEDAAPKQWGNRLLACSLCGHTFKVGDYWRWVYAPGNYLNLETCEKCDGADVLDRYKAACDLIRETGSAVATVATLHRQIADIQGQLADTQRALELIRENYLDGNPIPWAMEQARKERESNAKAEEK